MVLHGNVKQEEGFLLVPVFKELDYLFVVVAVTDIAAHQVILAEIVDIIKVLKSEQWINSIPVPAVSKVGMDSRSGIALLRQGGNQG